MNRLFGRGKPKEPPPNITDCIAGVSMMNLLLEKQHILFFTALYCHFWYLYREKFIQFMLNNIIPDIL